MLDLLHDMNLRYSDMHDKRLKLLFGDLYASKIV